MHTKGELKIHKEIDGVYARRLTQLRCGKSFIAKTTNQCRPANVSTEEAEANAERLALCWNTLY